MERFLGPLAFGASGALFGLWVLRADFRRMGFAAPRELAPRDAVRHFSGGLKTALCALAALGVWVVFGRIGLITLVSIGPDTVWLRTIGA